MMDVDDWRAEIFSRALSAETHGFSLESRRPCESTKFLRVWKGKAETLFGVRQSLEKSHP